MNALKLKYWLLIAFIASAFTNSLAQKTPSELDLALRMYGKIGELKKDQSVLVTDTIFYNDAYNSLLNEPYPVKNVITFKVEQDSFHISRPFIAKVKIRVIYWPESDPDNSINYDTELSVKFDTASGAIDTARSSFIFSKAHKLRVRIRENLTFTDLNGNTLNDTFLIKSLVLENRMIAQPDYKYDCSNNVINKIVVSKNAVTDSSDEVTVSWANVWGAEEYDLEWSYIDSSALLYSGRYTNYSTQPEKIFANNATRVTVTDLGYRIPLIYDTSGVLFVRVRPIRVRPDGSRIEVRWSSDYLPNGLGVMGYRGHENGLNWQSTISFAEDGKRKVVVQYYDGSLRNRQTVTKDNSTNQTVVAETMYDYQGRPVIQVLPAPTISGIIHYTRNFNQRTNGAEYDKDQYDQLVDPSAYCGTSAAAMGTASGASNYYSPDNPTKSTKSNKFIPDAKRFPFTETEYTQDNTGRISRQGGVGDSMQLGTGHETKYFYGGAPDQKELDALFGTEVGDRDHYQKNMVRDANGQFSVSYVDMHGRTIATALAGDVPGSLEKLDSYKVDTITEVLNDPQTSVIKDLVMESKKSLLVDMQGNYEFKYDLDPETLLKNNCSNTAVCYDCLYDLQITVTDDCNNQKIGNGKPYDTLIHNFSLLTFNKSGQCTDSGFHVTFTKNLQPGNYEVTKKLTVSRERLDFYRDSVFMPGNLCISLDSMIRWQASLQPHINCVTPPLSDTTQSDTADMRRMMLLDMTAPSGQYANPDPSKVDKYSIFYSTTNMSPLYQGTNIVYRDETGAPDSVYDDRTGTLVIPQKLDSAQFAQKFRPSWAEALLPLHPEYCKYQTFKLYEATLLWERKFRKVETYQEAFNRGFLNPTGILTSPYSKYPKLETDPSPAPYDSMNRYRTFSGKDYSLWMMASYAVKCPGGDSTCAGTITNASSFDSTTWCEGDLDMAWRYFRNMYLQIKKNIIDEDVSTPTCTGTLPPVYYTRSPSAQNLLDDSHRPNFLSGAEAFASDQSGTVTNPNDTAAIRGDVKDYYADNCFAYATMWAQQLSPCAYSVSELNNVIIPLLVEVCKKGADTDHPYGSRDIHPDSASVQGTYRSFDDVINTYNLTHPRDKSVCNADLITSPNPYNNQTVYGNKPIYTKPSACECEQINAFNTEYNTNKKPGETFSNYMLRRYSTSISNTDLSLMLNRCNTTSTCTFLQNPVYLPPVLQCYTGDVCISCGQLSTAYDDFVTAYGHVPLVLSTADTMQQRYNQLFANFMNNKFGFDKQAEEYISFMSVCGVSTAPATFCDTMSTALTQFPCYRSSLTDSLVHTGECNQKYWLLGGKNQAGSSITLNSPTQFINDSTLYFPSQLDTLLRGSAGYTLVRPICVSNQFAIEYSIKDALTGCNVSGAECTRGDVGFSFGSVDSGGTPSENFSFNFVQNNNQPNAYYTYRDSIKTDPVFRSRSFSTFKTVKLEVNPASFKIYYDNTLIKTVSRDGNSKIAKLYSLNFTMWGKTKSIDWIKIYTGNNYGNVVYNENFNGAANLARPDTNALCNRMPCEDEFADFYNRSNKTSYTYAQIRDKYFDSCGLILDPCHFAGETLCGKAVALFPPGTLDSVDNCSDTAFFAYSAGTELYKVYRDSLKNNFDSTYRSKCLNAFKYESFTVKHQRAEYHYTLYYYDQGGNLIKTVPPKGVTPIWRQTWLDSVALYRMTKPTTRLVPAHTLATRYSYNSLNQVIAQRTPDAGTSTFYYDRLGRLTLSQNAKQITGNKYSYTFYDYLGRITEVGELQNSASMTTMVSRTVAQLNAWLNATTLGTRAQITKTVYDQGNTIIIQKLNAKNLRGRVAWTGIFDAAADLTGNTYSNAIFYSYDFHGNVDTLLQDYGNSTYKPNVMNDPANGGNRWKKIAYAYDLISGNVSWVGYQPGQPDAFYHRYFYDAENRLTYAQTSNDSIYWEQDAYYEYYRHGPLSRLVLGDEKVQGVDYAYTIQGWLKGVNSTAPWIHDMIRDGHVGTAYARDAFGFALHYYLNDYKSIDNTLRPFAEADTTGFKNLYNGNIGAMSVYLPKLGIPRLYTYRYDQLNRFTKMQVATGLDTTQNQNIWYASITNSHKENVSYDANGNILKYNRYGNTASVMDSLTYTYTANTNKLSRVDDIVGAALFAGDIDDQAANNYLYDNIGNLIKDVKEKIDTIQWNVYGKITQIKIKDTTINYTYDASGNRISKAVVKPSNTITTWYIRDASGNVMSVYLKGDNALNGGALTQSEVHVYGSSRVGIYKPNLNAATMSMPVKFPITNAGDGYFIKFEKGKKFFELSNHLGNVLVTMSDKRVSIPKANPDQNLVSYYLPQVVSSSDYYPGGMQMPGRTYTSSSYRYGFNGQEKSAEIEPNGNSYTAEFWQYDAKIGRRWNLDPKPITGISQYSAFAGNPIWIRDPLGDTLDIGGNLSQSKTDLQSIVTKANQSFLKFDNNGRVNLDFGTLNKTQINSLLNADKGLSLLNNLVSSKKNYLFEASNYSFLRSAGGNRVGIITRLNTTSQSSIMNLSDAGWDSQNTLSFLPRGKYNGQVILDTKTTWEEPDPTGTTTVPKSRASMVFHELSENYYRTEFSASYQPKLQLFAASPSVIFFNPYSMIGAHNLAIKDEKSWHGVSNYPGQISSRFTSKVTTTESSEFLLFNKLYVSSGIPGFIF